MFPRLLPSIRTSAGAWSLCTCLSLFNAPQRCEKDLSGRRRDTIIAQIVYIWSLNFFPVLFLPPDTLPPSRTMHSSTSTSSILSSTRFMVVATSTTTSESMPAAVNWASILCHPRSYSIPVRFKNCSSPKCIAIGNRPAIAWRTR